MADETSETDDGDFHRYHFRKRPPLKETSKKKNIKKRTKKAKNAVLAPQMFQDDSLDLADDEHDCDIIIKEEPFYEDEEYEEMEGEEEEEEQEKQNYFEEVRMEDGPMLPNICDDANLDEESDPLDFNYPASSFSLSPSSNLPVQESTHSEDTFDSPDDASPSKRYTQTFFIKKEKDPDPPHIQIKKEKQEIESDNEENNLNDIGIPNDNLDLPFNTMSDINKIKLETNQESFGNFEDFESGINLYENDSVDNDIDPLAYVPLFDKPDLGFQDENELKHCQSNKPETLSTPMFLSASSKSSSNVSVQIYESNNEPNPFSKSDMLEKIASQINPKRELCKQVNKLVKPSTITKGLSLVPQQKLLEKSDFKEKIEAESIPQIFIHRGIVYRIVQNDTLQQSEPTKEEAVTNNVFPDSPTLMNIKQGDPSGTRAPSSTEPLNVRNIPGVIEESKKDLSKPPPTVQLADQLALAARYSKTVEKNGGVTKNLSAVSEYDEFKKNLEAKRLEEENTIWGRFEKSKEMLEAANWIPVEGTSNGVIQKYKKIASSMNSKDLIDDKVPPLVWKPESTNTKNIDGNVKSVGNIRNTSQFIPLRKMYRSLAPKLPIIPEPKPSLTKPSLTKNSLTKIVPAILTPQVSKSVESLSQSKNLPPLVKKGRKQELKPRLDGSATESKKEDKSIHKPRKQTLQVNDYINSDELQCVICCKNCKKTFQTVEYYDLHRKQYHEDVVNRNCKLCDEQCSSACEILTHYIYHTTVDKVNLCLLTKWDFMNPKAQVLEYIELFDGIGVGSFICICRRRFDFRRHLILHVNTYYDRCKSRLPKYQQIITIREKPIKTRGTMQRNIHEHNHRRELAREVREKFKQAQYYTQPKKNTKKLPKCRKCNLKFDNRCVYLEHIRFEHSETYYCEHCTFHISGSNKLKLQRHIIRHHLNKSKVTAAKVYLIDD